MCAHTCTHTHTTAAGARGGDDRVAIETVLFQVWSAEMIKSSISHSTYLMPFELSECKPACKHCMQKLPNWFTI